MKPAAKSRPEKPVRETCVGVPLAGMLVPVDLLAGLVEGDVGGAVPLLELAEGMVASLVELSI